MKHDEMNAFLETDTLLRRGECAAKELSPEGKMSTGRLVRHVRQLKKRLESRADQCRNIPGGSAEEWLLDNLYVVRRDLAACRSELRHCGALRRARGTALVLQAARGLVEAVQGRVDAPGLKGYLEGFQRRICLEEKELGVFGAVLRLSLLEYLEQQPDAAERVFPSLGWLVSADLSALLEQVNVLERLLRRDPGAVYAAMDRESRSDYRQQLSLLARRRGLSEEACARRVLQLAQGENRHIGYFLFDRPLGEAGRKKRCGLYLGLNLLLSTGLALLLSLWTESILCFVLVLLPIGDGVRYLLDCVIRKLRHPRRLPRLDYSRGIPEESRTLCVSVVLLTSAESAKTAAEKLERFRLANRDAGSGLLLGLLADLPEADTEHTERDEEILRAAAQAVEGLNGRYGGGFCLLMRKRQYSRRDRIWRGWERKRGAVTELLRLLRDRPGGVTLTAGDADCLRRIRFLLVLDGDTALTVGSAGRLAGTLAHPANAPAVDRQRRRIRSGCGILQPRVAVDLEAAGRSEFARVFAGQGGLDPYGSLSSDVYQDLFGEGSFSGKGLMDVDAAVLCLDGRFPPDVLLSHDLIEGAYLGCSFVGDIELADGFPASVLSYYQRQHRWIRGDWQTLLWLGAYVRKENGEREKNPITPLAKWKIFDNLRRSLVPAAVLFSLLLFGLFPGPGLLAAAAAGILSMGIKVLLNSASALRGGKRYRSGALSSAGRDFMQLFWLLLLLPYSAWIALHAVLTALYRMLISRRRLLQWVTAAESDQRSRGGAALYWRRLFACPAAAAAAFLGSSVLLQALGAAWLLTPLLAWAISREERRSVRPLSQEAQAFLLQCAGDIWHYFRHLVTAQRNWLPPDNLQEEPEEMVAERTSPTNIGLMLLSAAAAWDLGLSSREEAFSLAAKTLETLERMSKFRGHLYNWYDILSLQPLEPRFVSTVDSGNLIACLIAFRAAAEEAGYRELGSRAAALAAAMPLDFLYDRERRLLRIGWDPAEDRPGGGWYDLLESEARLSSYVAVARGEADHRHWRRLGRVLAGDGRRSGLASWTGTMFEYFMPELLLPSAPGSLLWESLDYCLWAQKKRGRNGVWGCSESAFYKKDAASNYQYKAHGVQALALKRGMDRELVIAPYAVFLALQKQPAAALRCLKRLRAMGAEGNCGFYEALDFTAQRVGEGWAPVRCYMAHHLAMSLLAVDNVLREGILHKRFLRDGEMAAFTELVQEKTPVGQRIRTVSPYQADPRPERKAAEGWLRSRESFDPEAPACGLLSNGRYSVLISELGDSRSLRGNVLLASWEPRRFGQDRGILFFAYCGGQLLPLQPAPACMAGMEYHTEYNGSRWRQYARGDGWEFRLETAVSASRCGEKRSLRIRNHGSQRQELTLACCFFPALCAPEDYAAHPAFHRLCMESRILEGCLVTSRRPGGHQPPRSCAVSCSEVFDAQTDAGLLFGRGGLQALPAAMAARGTQLRDSGETCVFLRLHLSLRSGETREVRFAFALEETAEQAARSAREILRENGEQALFRRCVRNAALEPAGLEAAFRLLSGLVYPSEERRRLRERYAPWDRGREGLWRWGISGDLPLAAGDGAGGEKLLRCWALLYSMGYACDLALRLHDEGVYGRPEHTALSELARELGLGARLGARGGIHFIGGTEEDWRAVLARADCLELPPAGGSCRAVSRVPWFLPAEAENRAVRQVHYRKEGVAVQLAAGAGLRVWSHMLTGGQLGWLATDTGSGNLWLDNAREQRLTPWCNDALQLQGPERLELLRDGKAMSLYCYPDGAPSEFRPEFGCVCWKRRFGRTETEVCGFLPRESPVRMLRIRLKNWREGDRIRFYVRPEESWVGRLRLEASARPVFSWDDSLAFRTEGQARSGEICICREYPAGGELILGFGTGDPGPWLSGEGFRKGLEESRRGWLEFTGKLQLRSPSPALDRYLNGWALYQVLACRLMGRCSVYQSGGAFGFRDQLQDVCALVDFAPRQAADYLCYAAEHQYEEGDVMHWWHALPEGDRGVRTRCSDDLLWLPYAVSVYVEKTGDRTILERRAPWLHSAPLAEGERDRYESPETLGDATLLEHCLRAADRVRQRGCGPHGLLKFGSGDWNDGYDRVEGESVWLTWFAAMVFRDLGRIAGEGSLCRAAEELGRAAEASWSDGQYLRGWYADGSPLGAAGGEECAIDSLSQSFAVLSGFGDPRRSREAVKKAARELIDLPSATVALFTPPFDGSQDPGYICSYLPGVRENGGQYTHAAVWLAAAALRCGETELGWKLLDMLLPGGKEESVYQGEPYVLAADVYTHPDMPGRAGWTWYTGAAGWFLRTAVEELLGIRMRGGVPEVRPRLPEHWQGYEAVCSLGAQRWKICVSCREEGTEVRVETA